MPGIKIILSSPEAVVPRDEGDGDPGVGGDVGEHLAEPLRGRRRRVEPAAEDADALAEVYDEIDTLERSEIVEFRFLQYRELGVTEATETEEPETRGCEIRSEPLEVGPAAVAAVCVPCPSPSRPLVFSSTKSGVSGSSSGRVGAAHLAIIADIERRQAGDPLVQIAVDADTVSAVVSGWTGIPVGRTSTTSCTAPSG